MLGQTLPPGLEGQTLTALAPDVLKEIVAALSGDDALRLRAVSRDLSATMSTLLSPGAGPAQVKALEARALLTHAVFRYNSTWVDLATQLVRPDEDGGGDDGADDDACACAGARAGAAGAAGGDDRPLPRLYLTAVNRQGNVEFLDRVLEMARFRGGLTNRYRQYTSWHDLEEAARAGHDPDLFGALGLVNRYRARTRPLIEAMLCAKVANKADADYILGTCHKAKGMEEDYVQLADDFSPIRTGLHPAVPIDEYNLLYVAATRAKIALVCNMDVEQLVLLGEHRSIAVQPPPELVAEGQGGQPEQQQDLQCSCCGATHNTAAAIAANVGGVGFTAAYFQILGLQPAVLQALLQQMQSVCSRCVQRRTVWGEVAAEPAA